MTDHVLKCARCGVEVKDGRELCADCDYHLEYHESRCAECVPRAERDGQDWWRGYHARDSQVSQLVMQITRFKRLIKEATHD